jgi:ADP-ribosylation factor-like protein 2
MGLLTIIKKVKQKEREMRLLMVGLDNAGKTTIVKKFNGERIDTISPTLGFNIKTLEFLGYRRLIVRDRACQTSLLVHRYKLNIWDVGGQTTLRACALWRPAPHTQLVRDGPRFQRAQVLAELLRSNGRPHLGC